MQFKKCLKELSDPMPEDPQTLPHDPHLDQQLQQPRTFRKQNCSRDAPQFRVQKVNLNLCQHPKNGLGERIDISNDSLLHHKERPEKSQFICSPKEKQKHISSNHKMMLNGFLLLIPECTTLCQAPMSYSYQDFRTLEGLEFGE